VQHQSFGTFLRDLREFSCRYWDDSEDASGAEEPMKMTIRPSAKPAAAHPAIELPAPAKAGTPPKPA
jgi:hypothetical protein